VDSKRTEKSAVQRLSQTVVKIHQQLHLLLKLAASVKLTSSTLSAYEISKLVSKLSYNSLENRSQIRIKVTTDLQSNDSVIKYKMAYCMLYSSYFDCSSVKR